MARMSVGGWLVAAFLGSQCPAQDWAREMFERTSHDFGSVARGAKAEHAFVLTNPYTQDVHLSAVRSTCGCTTPRIEKDTLRPYEAGAVIAHINSDRFLGRNGATITVTFDRPAYAQAQLHVRVFIRGDVSFEPEYAMLGSVPQGMGANTKIRVRRVGDGDWCISEVRSANPHLSARAEETARTANEVAYELHVRLDEKAPPGPVKDYLFLVTNDPKPVQIPVSVEGQVVPAVSVSPATIFFGVVPLGQKVTKTVVLHGKKPFHVTKIEPECECLRAASPGDKEPRQVFVIPVTFKATGAARQVTKAIRFQTDAKASVQCVACAGVIEESAP